MSKPKKNTIRPPLPKLRRHKWREAGWLGLEPARVGTVVACAAAGITLLYCFLRQMAGTPMTIADVCLGVAKTFVVSYAASGLFVLYLLWVAERELTPPEEHKKGKGLKDEKKSAAKAEGNEVLDAMTEALERLESDEYEPVNTEEP